MNDKPTDTTSGRMTAVPRMGALIGIGAGLGLTVGVLLGDITLGLSIGAGLGTVAGAIAENHRRERTGSRQP